LASPKRTVLAIHQQVSYLPGSDCIVGFAP
jgi:hypothetical protein